MTKIKLVDGTVLNVSNVELVKGVLKITTSNLTVEELATLFTNKENTNRIVFLTESGAESGYKVGFTSFAGIAYGADGTKVVEMFQPKDVTEARISKAEGMANTAKERSISANNAANAATTVANEANITAISNSEKIQVTETSVTDIEMALVEIYELMAGGVE